MPAGQDRILISRIFISSMGARMTGASAPPSVEPVPKILAAYLNLSLYAAAAGAPAAAAALRAAAATLPGAEATEDFLAQRQAEHGAAERWEADIAAQGFEGLKATIDAAKMLRDNGEPGQALVLSRLGSRLSPRDAWRWLDLAKDLQAVGQTEEAEAAYQQVLAFEPGNVHAMLPLGQSARARGAHDVALTAFAAAADALPDDIWRWLDVAREQEALGLAAEEARSYRRILELAPDNLLGVLGLARCARRQGEREQALALFSQAAAMAPRDVWRWLDVGEELSALGRLEAAEEAFRQACAAAPGDVPAALRLAECIRARGGEAAALAFFEDYAAQTPDALWARLHVAASLRTLERLDEADAICHAVLAQAPDNAEASLGLGRGARQRRDHKTALAWFEKAVAQAPRLLWPQVEMVQELRATGAALPALAAAEALLAQHPGELTAMLAVAQCLRDCGRHEDALARYEQITCSFPHHDGALVELAAQERLLGRHEAADAHLRQVLDRDPLNAAAIGDLGRTALLLGDLAEAHRLFSTAAAARPGEALFQMGVIDTLAAAGEIDDAIERLVAREEAQGPLAALRAKRIVLLRQIGRSAEALTLARDTTALYPDNFWLWFERFFCEMQGGPGSAVALCLERMPTPAAREYGMRQRCRGLYAESLLQYNDALHYYAAAAALLPDDTAPRNDLARASFITMDLGASLTHLRRVSALEAHNNNLLGRPLNVSQTHYGQILDEYRLDRHAADAAAKLWRQPPRARLRELRALVAAAPSNTALATSLLLAMRQDRPIHGAAVPGAFIPRIIHQYWDKKEVPPDIARLMQSWPALNPGWTIHLLDDNRAQILLNQHFPPPVLAAYQRIREPAQRADMLRLALLALHGGVYADSDDRCLRPLTAFLPEGATLVLYQEDLGTLGNNFIAVTPRHPVILAALQQVLTSIARGDSDIVWLSTGPALLSRVVAEWLAGQEQTPEGLYIFDRREAFQAIGMHCAAGYKRAGKHWLETSFGKRTRHRSESPDQTKS